jgi:tetratricopeptide (TPR) repeat protein
MPRPSARRRRLATEALVAARAALEQAYFRTGDYDAATDLAAQALEDARASGDRAAEAAALAQEGMVLHYRAIELPPNERAEIDHGPEQELFEQALALRDEIGDAEGRAESLFQLALVDQVLRRDGASAAPRLQEAAAIVEELPEADPYLRSEIHRHLGFDLLLRQERADDAILHLQTSLELRRVLPERGRTFSGLLALAMAERLAGRDDDARAHAREALAIAGAERLRRRHVAAAENELRAAEGG